ncbi:Transmembrane secretion effector [Micromonospora rhizosphaerae]|uniref:Transmembrane secretion effector n=1 Tax=Micromonospora rhizosphaerae TaxID=568872 RepID=A0A1C6RSK6_9ACTN|nr:MFS transporter [Micromonospora rhizosphaerae]SCL20194.1 Transmembrane secretion effector [Micromonospora rhizosphaerae]
MIDKSGSPLSNAAFRRVWIGATVSAAGDAASWVALVAYALGLADGSVATLAVLYTAPVAVGGLVAGWALDRYDRRWLLVGDSLLRAVVFGTVPLAAALGGLTDTHLYLVAAVYGLLKMTSLAGFPALIPVLVPPRQLMAANALESVSFGIAGLVGAVGAGIAVATVGPGYVVAVDVLSYLVFAVCLVGTRISGRPARAVSRPAAARRRRGGLGPVLRLMVREPVLRDTTIMFALFNIGEGALLVVLPERAVEFGLGAGGYGYLVAAVTGGELLAALVLLRWSWRPSLTRSVVLASLVAAVAVLAVLAPSPWMAVVGLVGLGGCAAAMTTWAQTLRMTAAPAGVHGRLFALLRTLMQATPPLGAGLAALTLRDGVAATVLAICALMAVPALLFARDLTAAGAQLAADRGVPEPDRAAIGGQA